MTSTTSHGDQDQDQQLDGTGLRQHHNLTIRLHVCTDEPMVPEDVADKVWNLLQHGSIRETFRAADMTFDAPESVESTPQEDP